MGKIEKVGNEQPLTENSPLSYERKPMQGGMIQKIGDCPDISAKPVPSQMYNKNIQGGEIQGIGTSADLSHTPRRGWESASTPMSERSSKQGPAKG